jgi:hypothetical protein
MLVNWRNVYSARYRANAPRLESVLCLMETFERYDSVPKVAALRDTVDMLAKGLHAQLLREFQLQWLVSDPFAGSAVATGASYDERQRARTAQEQVRSHCAAVSCHDRTQRCNARAPAALTSYLWLSLKC